MLEDSPGVRCYPRHRSVKLAFFRESTADPLRSARGDMESPIVAFSMLRLCLRV